MIFDKLCQFYEVAENRWPEEVAMSLLEKDNAMRVSTALKMAALFHLPRGLKEFKHLGVDDERPSQQEREDIDERLLFPFQVVAIEDDINCMVLGLDKGYANEVGLYNMKRLISIEAVMSADKRSLLVVGPGIWDASVRRETPGDGWETPKATCLLSPLGAFEFQLHGNRAIRGVPIWEGRTAEEPGEKQTEMIRSHWQNVYMALRQLRVIMHPNNYIVQRTNEKARPVQRGSIPRSDQRARHVIVTQSAIHRMFRPPSGVPGQKLKEGHRRRACWHTLKSGRFRFKQGQRIPIKSCWVGPTTGHEGNEKYEVLVDLRAMEVTETKEVVNG